MTAKDKKPLITYFGGIPLRRQKHAVLYDMIPLRFDGSRNELIKRPADTCELCRAPEHCEVHHIRKLADLKVKGRKEKPPWVQRMAARQRKTLVVCRDCHNAIHAGRLTRQSVQARVTGEPRETGTLMRGSERGRQKVSARADNSLAAYSTPRSRSPRSSLGWGKPTTWRRGTGRRHGKGGRVREGKNLTSVYVVNWRAD